MPFNATATLAASRFVDLDGAYPAAGATADGITRHEAVSGEIVSATVLGTEIVQAEEAIALGANVAVGTNGHAKTADDDEVVVGKAFEPAVGNGSFLEVIKINYIPTATA